MEEVFCTNIIIVDQPAAEVKRKSLCGVVVIFFSSRKQQHTKKSFHSFLVSSIVIVVVAVDGCSVVSKSVHTRKQEKVSAIPLEVRSEVKKCKLHQQERQGFRPKADY